MPDRGYQADKDGSKEYAAEVIIRLSVKGFSMDVPSAMIISAHPDDEIIGAGGLLRNLKKVSFLNATDGAPRDMQDARVAGFRTRKGYATARKKELYSALSMASIRPEQCMDALIPDQEAAYRLPELAKKIARAVRIKKPEVVLTQPYEGGHPDHDSTAFAVHAAKKLLEREGEPGPLLLEFTSYHARDGGMAAFEFLPRPGCEITTVVLSAQERALKRMMMECFITQQKVLSGFQNEIEKFRPAPLYDFTAPPHQGQLYYERFDRGITSARWRELAKEAMDHLGIEGLI